MVRTPWPLLALLALAPLAARAHDADIVYVQARRTPGPKVQVQETITLTAQSLQQLAPVDADGDLSLTQADLDGRAEAIGAGVWDQMPMKAGQVACSRQGQQALAKDTFIELRAEFLCPEGELMQTFRILQVLPKGYKVVLSSQTQGAQGQRFAQGNAQSLELFPARPPPAGKGLLEWFTLGVWHIWEGFDHLAFLAALLLVGGGVRRILLLVSAFTLAHSLTLGVTALGVLTLPDGAGRWVEVFIALSILWVALENLLLRQHRHRAGLAFGFGLVHGFGFAAQLSSYGLGNAVVTGLLGFNLGVEAGQAALVVLFYPILLLLQRRPHLERWVVRSCSVLLLLMGGYWLVQRGLG